MSRRKRRRPRGPSPTRIVVYAAIIIAGLLFANSYAYFGRLIVQKDWSAQGPATATAIAAATTYDGAKVMANALRVALDDAPIPMRSDLETIHLRVEDGSLEAMTANLPASAKARYYRARLLYPDGQWRKINYRLRGRGHWHWDKAKPSLRLKLRKSAPLDMQRHINLINPEDRPMVANPLGEELARRLGLLTHRTDFVRLFINGQFRGVYHRTTREDESLLRLRKRLPGPIFEAYSLAPRWRAADFRVMGDTDVLESLDPLDQMVEAIYLPNGPDRFERLWGALDFDKYARFAALMSLVSGTHADAFHNHLFYFDPGAGRIEPWITDINGHGMLLYPSGPDRFNSPDVADHQVPLNELITPLRDAALRDPRLAHHRNVLLYNALTGTGAAQAQHRILDDYFARMDADVRADQAKGALDRDFLEPYRLPFSNAQFAAAKADLYRWIERRNAFLVTELEKVQVHVRTAPGPAADQVLAEVTVDGNAAVRFNPASLGGPVRADRELGASPVEQVQGPLLLHPGLKEDTGPMRRSLRVFRRVPAHALVAGPQRYLLSLPKAGVPSLKHAFRNAVTGATVETTTEAVARLTPADIVYTDTSVHPWRFAQPKANALTMGPGVVTLRETLKVSASETLRIAPGTTLRLHPGVSIISRGRLTIAGTETQPVSVERAVADRPWGVIAVQGGASAGSEIAHAAISGGSVARDGLVDYIGMVSAHHSPAFAMRAGTLQGNAMGDDTLHIVGGSFRLDGTRFRNCHGDCIDLDYADGIINLADVGQAGNDGIDFMGSTVTVDNTTVSGAGDKALSVGEASTVTVIRTHLTRSAIGIAVKDASALELSQSILDDHGTALDIYAKNWRYGGPGRAVIRRSAFAGNALDVRAQAGGRAHFVNQPVPPRIDGKGTIGIIRESGA